VTWQTLLQRNDFKCSQQQQQQQKKQQRALLQFSNDMRESLLKCVLPSYPTQYCCYNLFTFASKAELQSFTCACQRMLSALTKAHWRTPTQRKTEALRELEDTITIPLVLLLLPLLLLLSVTLRQLCYYSCYYYYSWWC
jgi:hypothetical protein